MNLYEMRNAICVAVMAFAIATVFFANAITGVIACVICAVAFVMLLFSILFDRIAFLQIQIDCLKRKLEEMKTKQETEPSAVALDSCSSEQGSVNKKLTTNH